MISCFINEYGVPGEDICSENCTRCVQYKFNLEKRGIVLEDKIGQDSFDKKVAQRYFDHIVGTPEKLVQYTRYSRVSKLSLAQLLIQEARQDFLEICGDLERRIVEECKAKNDPCLESGCATDGETCLQANLIAGELYFHAYSAIWISFFIKSENRILAWKR